MIHICFNVDEKYILPCKVLIRNIDTLTPDEITYHFIGIDKCDMKTKNKCVFYPNPDTSYFLEENLTDYKYLSGAAMYRLGIPFMIDTDKALYMDCDMLVFKNLKELWDIEVDYVGAVPDPLSVRWTKSLKHGADIYYNSGLILFNSKKIRENMNDYKEQILLAQKNYELFIRDQDIFNIVFKNKITKLPYNWNISCHNEIEEEDKQETIEQKNAAIKNPYIVHCMGIEKWWDYYGVDFGAVWDIWAGKDIPKNRKPSSFLGTNI